MSGHTPGPWHAVQVPSGLIHIQTVDESSTIAIVPRAGDFTNAYLLAMAPELLGALEEIVGSSRECESCDGSGRRTTHQDDACSECGGTGEYAVVATIPDVRAAIAAARGLEDS